MIRKTVAEKISTALHTLVVEGALPEVQYPAIEIAEPRQPEHGDFACSIALAASKAAGKPPRVIADALAERLRLDSDFETVEVAGPGFLNLRLSSGFVGSFVGDVLSSADLSPMTDLAHYAHVSVENPQRINVEFVSVNPNGPITIGSGRGAAYGSTLCNVLETAGNTVHREYYINDGTSSEQMRLFAESVKAILEKRPVPDNGYKGDYVYEVASQLETYLHTPWELPSTYREDFAVKVLARLKKNSYQRRLDTRDISESRVIPARFAIENHVIVISASTDRLQLGTDKPLGEVKVNVPELLSCNVSFEAVPTSTVRTVLRSDYDFAYRSGSPMARLHDAILTKAAEEGARRVQLRWTPENVVVHYEIDGKSVEAMTIPNSLGSELRYTYEYSCLKTDDVQTIDLLEEPSKLKALVEWTEDQLNIEILDTPAKPFKRGTLEWCQSNSQYLMIQAQKRAMELMGVEYDTWFSEQSLHTSGMVGREVQQLIANHAADTTPIRHKLKLAKGGVIEDVEIESQTKDVDDEGNAVEASQEQQTSDTLWLRSTKFADDMDRVLRRRDGRTTYIASDVAYHKDKFNRPENADHLITVLGPDHHGYIGRLTAVVAAALLPETQTEDPNSPELSEIEAKLYSSKAERDTCRRALAEAREKLTVQIYQLVRFMKDGKPAPMRKRDGNIYALIDLINEIGAKVKPSGTVEEQQEAGKDVARFFYLMRHHDTTFDFDLDLAEKQSDENPVFYVQYAHARI